MNPGDIITQIIALIDFFHARCSETETLDALRKIALDRQRWPEAHALFCQIRIKNLSAQKTGSHALAAQHLFEEIVAKTLYNLSGASAPFDADSAFFVIPNAISLTRTLGQSAVSELVSLLGLSGEVGHH